MTSSDYWKTEVEKACKLAAMPGFETGDPEIAAALLVARQLQVIATQLSTIQTQLGQIQYELMQ